MLSFVSGALTGAGFGVVLYKVGATRYSRVMGMVTLRDTKVMKFAFTAIAVASLCYGLAATTGLATSLHLVPRTMPFLGWAHVLGGVLFGVAMGVSGLCPGTCVAKFGGRGGATKWQTPAAIAGLFAGVLAYDVLKAPLTDAGIIAVNQKALTVPGVLGLPYGAVALLFGAVMLAVTFAADRVMPEHSFAPARAKVSALDWLRGEWSWAAAGTVGGLLVVLATAQSGYLGFSGAVLALTGWIAHAVGMPLEVVPTITDDIIWRAALIVGVLPGGMLAAALSLQSKAAVESPLPKVFQPRIVTKSFFSAGAMSLGAMIGGGCTTGAFISAWPTLSIGSFCMGGTFFAVSMLTGNGRIYLSKTLDLATAQAEGDRVYD
ncbi:MAG: YeeE/YedE family protein [Deltaproteobacteria bacterium]|nr:YeeE/YedE family protein [Deltaproteobacteria bacterium]